MNSCLANSILVKITHFYEVTSKPICSENMIGKSKNMVLFCVLRLWHINLGMCKAQNKLAVKQKGT